MHLQMNDVNKSFATNHVLKNMQLELQAGEVHALLGENGAGKSTLMKILGGIYTKDSGQIIIDGKNVEINAVADARQNGISVIPQERMMARHMTIAENIFMGQELHGVLGLSALRQQENEAQKMMDVFGMNLSSHLRLEELTVAQQQMVEIVRATSFGARIIVMDEPTASLSDQEVEVLFNLIRTLTSQNVGIVYISHRLNELFAITNRITVMRDGEYIATVNTAQTQREELIKMMVGRELSSLYTKTTTATDEVVMEVQHLTDGNMAKDVSFTLHKGEILGFGGLVGAGRSEAMKCLFGLSRRTGGSIKLFGQEVSFKNARQAMSAGIGYVTEDRKNEGLFLQQTTKFNITIAILDKLFKLLHYKRKSENAIAEKSIQDMQIKVTGADQIAGNLSGGNQQKVLISRWLQRSEHVLILDEPTVGVDVKTKAEIYALINKLAEHGLAIIMISSDLPELINMSDRVVVMSDGIVSGTLHRNELNQETIMTLATAAFAS